MFRKLMTFSYQRTALQAFGWYLTFLLIGAAIGGLAGGIAVTGAPSFSEGFQRGIPIGQLVAIPYHIILGILLLWARSKGLVNIGLVLAGVLLSVRLGGLGGAIPLAVLTTRPAKNAGDPAEVFE
jgi:hypothetical protein